MIKDYRITSHLRHRATHPKLTESLTRDCIVQVKEPYFSGTYRNAKFEGERFYEGTIIKESYGSGSGQHTFTIEIISSDFKQMGEKIRRKGRNIYPNLVSVQTPKNHTYLCEEKENRRPNNLWLR